MNKIELEINRKGFLGVFSTEKIKKNELILTFTGNTCSSKEEIFFKDVKYNLQVGPDTYIKKSQLIDDFVNHSCNPNSYIKIFKYKNNYIAGLFALEDLEPATEIYFDYCITHTYTANEGFKCGCNDEDCTGYISTWHGLSGRKVFKYLLKGLFPWYVIKEIFGELI